ncbi:MAG: UvrD-helicase domain-containing protein [Actinobacteria bacterium]|nr:UvrD-helicase domain-containing protein [Actinomycetota bacterium]
MSVEPALEEASACEKAPSLPQGELMDSKARQRVVTDLDQSLFVAAGAGTGKTTVLVERALALVCSLRTRACDLAAITFTEAAASELRERIQKALGEAVRAGKIAPAALADLDRAAVGTIHAFAYRLLAEADARSGLPPALEILDSGSEALDFYNRWREFTDELIRSAEEPRWLRRGLTIGVKLANLREAALYMQGHWDRIAASQNLGCPNSSESLDPSKRLSQKHIERIEVRRLLEHLRAAVALSGYCNDEGDRLLHHLKELSRYADRLEETTDEDDLLALLAGPPARLSANRIGKKQSWDSQIEHVRAQCEAAERERSKIMGLVGKEVIDGAVETLSRFTLTAAEQRRKEGRLTFHDLLVRACILLNSDRQALQDARDRWSHLLIDEFQDTDPLQVELALLLSGEPMGPESSMVHERDDQGATSPRPPTRPSNGRLFLVGDGQQSIYRFRRADTALFSSVATSLGSPVALKENFRSVPGILEWINQVMASMAPGDRPKFITLAAHREPLTSSKEPPVMLLGGALEAGPNGRTTAGQVRAEEATAVALALASVVADRWLVQDRPGPGEPEAKPRPARFGDIAVLMPTRSGLTTLERALQDMRIPYRMESAALIWQSEQIRYLRLILSAVSDPSDEVSLIAALRSPYLACGDDDLVAYKLAGGCFDPATPPPPGLPADHPVSTALQKIAHLRERLRWLKPSAALEEVARELGFFELALAHTEVADAWEQLRWVIDQARSYDGLYQGSLRGLCKWMAIRARAKDRARFVAHQPSDAVHLLTIHGAKGLEFPVVVVTGLGHKRRGSSSGTTVLWESNGAPSLRLGRVHSESYDSLAAIEESLEEEEQLRLLYVALTRARDHLIVSLYHKAGSPCLAHELYKASMACPHLWRTLNLSTVQDDTSTLQDTQGLSSDFNFMADIPRDGIIPLPEAPTPAWREAWIAARSRTIATSKAPVISATSLTDSSGEPSTIPVQDSETSPPSWMRFGSGVAIGRAVHTVLQMTELGAPGNVVDLVRSVAYREDIPHRLKDVAAMVHRALSSPTVLQAGSVRHWKEVYVSANVNGGVVEGYIDLLYETSGGLVIVDYKTDRIGPDGISDGKLERHSLQLGCYALALEASQPLRVAKGTLLYLDAGSHVLELELADLAAIKEQAASKLGQAFGSQLAKRADLASP